LISRIHPRTLLAFVPEQRLSLAFHSARRVTRRARDAISIAATTTGPPDGQLASMTNRASNSIPDAVNAHSTPANVVGQR